jgi:hypothetical protein
MSASAAVHGLFGMPRAGAAFRRLEAGEDATPWCGWDDRVENIRKLLYQDGCTISQLSAATRWRYGSKSPYFIPPTFLYQLRRGVTPHVCQVVALSESTGYRFVDWMRMCGFDLQQIPRLQMRLHRERTVLLTPIEDFLNPFRPQPSPTYAAGWNSSACSGPGNRGSTGRYLFAQIGNCDAVADPRLLPGSVVRVDRYYAQRMRGIANGAKGNLLWLVEQSDGLTCSPVRWIDHRHIVLLPSRPPWGRWPLRVPTEARILGLVDLNDHPLLPANPEAGPAELEHLFPPGAGEERARFSGMLRLSRARTGLTFRAAHLLTRLIAQILGNGEHVIALGLLSDYEAMSRLPRHIAKILSLCVVYCMDIRELLAAEGVHIDDSGKLALPLSDRRFHPRAGLGDHAASHGSNGRESAYAQSAGGRP